MIRPLLILIAVASMGVSCSRRGKSDQTAQVSLIKTDTLQALVDFSKDIQPILQTNCTPCHFPGGKMYNKMPFDNPQTIRDHSEGIFRRIKNPEEMKKLKAFLEQKI